MKKQPKVAILIVTYNSDLKLLRGCLDSLKKVTDYNNYKVIISDNGSTNGSNEMIKKDYKWVDLIENNANIYFAGGCNSAIKYSLKKYDPDYYFLLNDDIIIIDKNWLSEVVKTAESDPKIGLVGTNPIYEDGISQNVGGYFKGPLITLDKEATGLVEFDHITAFFLASRKVIKKVGLFDEIFTPYLLDETDYCMRVKKAGFKLVSRTDIKIVHYKGVTINRDAELKRNYVRLKNDIIFSLINMKLHYGIIRVLFYLPLVTFLKKKNEKGNVTIKNAKFKDNFLKNIVILMKGYWYMLSHLKLIYKKRLDRKIKIKIWY
ncbi:glycosyltransferase family 2 protein [Candidatus Pacearchaeota archaeon]|nr:glycosyltransferase family 2 protein [Candidatus Pacearchaeota archaeon]